MKLNRIQEVLDDSGKSPKWFAEELNTTTVMVNKWCKNKSQLSLKKLYMISKLLKC
jgi:DNA-binding transcriptional regulator YiaG